MVGDRNRFIRERRDDAEQSLRGVEIALREFYDTNRLWEESAQLRVDQGRLTRELNLRQQIYVTLAQDYERTRIEELDDVLAIAVIDRAVPPRLRSAPRRRRMVTLALFFGGALATIWVFAVKYGQFAFAEAYGTELVSIRAFADSIVRIRHRLRSPVE